MTCFSQQNTAKTALCQLHMEALRGLFSCFVFIYYGVKWKVLEDVLLNVSPCFHPLPPCFGMFSTQKHKPEHVPSLLKALQQLPISFRVKSKGPQSPTRSCMICRVSLPYYSSEFLSHCFMPYTLCSNFTIAKVPCYSLNTSGTYSCFRTFVLSIWSASKFLPPAIYMVHSHQGFTHMLTSD